MLNGILRLAAQRFSVRRFTLWRKYFGPQNRTFRGPLTSMSHLQTFFSLLVSHIRLDKRLADGSSRVARHADHENRLGGVMVSNTRDAPGTMHTWGPHQAGHRWNTLNPTHPQPPRARGEMHDPREPPAAGPSSSISTPEEHPGCEAGPQNQGSPRDSPVAEEWESARRGAGCTLRIRGA